MNNPQTPEDPSIHASRNESMSALFANMVIQQTNMTLMLLGRMPHPETGETFRDIEGAKIFIDQLEMLEVKTRGNLDAREDKLLKQSLTALRMAFVEAIDKPSVEADSPPPSSSGETARPAETTQAPSGTQPSAPSAEAEDESRKKFSKKY